MPRIERVDVGGYIYHVLNRANAHVQIFDSDEDYRTFEDILEKGVKEYDVRLLAYCLMSNHWHLVLETRKDGELSKFMGWITNTHTRRWHTTNGTIGQGHLYQGRYKSFLCEEQAYFLTLVRYVERNAKKANLVRHAQDWKWSSIWRREYGSFEQQQLLSVWPATRPTDYLRLLNEPQTADEEDAIERSVAKNIPYGDDRWVDAVVKQFGLEQTLRPIGRPKNGG